MDREACIKNITSHIASTASDLFGSRLVSVILYGSYARGDYDPESDVDIMLLVDMRQEEYRSYRNAITALSSDLSLENDVTVSIKIKDSNLFSHYKDTIPFYKNVLDDGVPIDVKRIP